MYTFVESYKSFKDMKFCQTCMDLLHVGLAAGRQRRGKGRYTLAAPTSPLWNGIY